MTSQSEELHQRLSVEVDLGGVAKLLEEVPPDERIALVHSLSAAEQARLWTAAQGRAVTIEEMVPRELGPLQPVIFHGKNSLPAFSRFQKRFCRPAAGVERDELWGYNYQPTRWLAPLTGPGYFVAYDAREATGAVAVDYTKLPGDHPAEWPEIVDNSHRLSRFIYRNLVDYLRRVSPHVLIGRATREGKPLPNYFVLCREDP